jgi:hypothetical protein
LYKRMICFRFESVSRTDDSCLPISCWASWRQLVQLLSKGLRSKVAELNPATTQPKIILTSIVLITKSYFWIQCRTNFCIWCMLVRSAPTTFLTVGVDDFTIPNNLLVNLYICDENYGLIEEKVLPAIVKPHWWWHRGRGRWCGFILEDNCHNVARQAQDRHDRNKLEIWAVRFDKREDFLHQCWVGLSPHSVDIVHIIFGSIPVPGPRVSPLAAGSVATRIDRLAAWGSTSAHRHIFVSSGWRIWFCVSVCRSRNRYQLITVWCTKVGVLRDSHNLFFNTV